MLQKTCNGISSRNITSCLCIINEKYTNEMFQRTWVEAQLRLLKIAKLKSSKFLTLQKRMRITKKLKISIQLQQHTVDILFQFLLWNQLFFVCLNIPSNSCQFWMYIGVEMAYSIARGITSCLKTLPFQLKHHNFTNERYMNQQIFTNIPKACRRFSSFLSLETGFPPKGYQSIIGIGRS